MSEEEKKAIKYFWNLRATIDESNMLFDEDISVKCGKEIIKQITIILNLTKKQDKIIDLMAKHIEDELTVDEFCSKKNCYADNYINGHCEKCLNCIKEYFRKKVENDN